MDVPAFSKCFPPNVPELLVTLQLSCLKLPKWSENHKKDGIEEVALSRTIET